MDDKTLNPGPWTDAESCPPETKPESWSRGVIGVTNFRNVFKIHYYNGTNTGTWQQSTFFMQSEMIKR